MNQKTLQVLSILINSPQQYFSYEDLASALSVSTRSVRNYILVIRDYLEVKEPERSLLSVTDKGIAFMGSAKEGRSIYLSLSENRFYMYRLSPNERVWMILLWLLLSDSYLKLSDFSERFNSSRATALKDMEQVRKLSEHHSLSFSPLINKGYRLTVAEPLRRQLIEKIIANNSLSGLRQPSNLFYQFLVEECRLEEHGLAELILNLEVKYELNISDACFDELLLFVLIAAARLKRGHAIISGELEAESKTNRQTAEIAKEMLTELVRIEPEASLPAGYGHEADLLAGRLQSCRFYRPVSGSNGNDMQLRIALSYFLVRISQELSVPFYKDNAMMEMLELHLNSMIKLHAGGSVIENAYTRSIINEYPEYYKTVSKHKSILENISGYEYRDEDIVFVIMYLLVSADQYFTDDVLPRVIVCCHTGMGTANFLAKQLKEYYHIRIVAVTSNHKLPELMKMQECDMVISTMPLPETDRAWIKVSPMLTDKNIIELTTRFAAIKKEKGYKRIQQNVERFSAKEQEGSAWEHAERIDGFCESNILLDITCNCPEEAIRLSAKPLIENGSIEPEYVDAIIDFYHENGAYFVYCPNVALAHAGPDDGANSFAFSVLRLNPGVPFHKELYDPVRYVICMSLTDKQSHAKEVLNIMTLFSIPENIESLNNLYTARDIYQFILNKWEDTKNV